MSITALTRKIQNLRKLKIELKFHKNPDIYFAFYLISILKQGVQELQVFAFCVITANNKRTEPRLKRRCIG